MESSLGGGYVQDKSSHRLEPVRRRFTELGGAALIVATAFPFVLWIAALAGIGTPAG
jgi:hypothetical protein